MINIPLYNELPEIRNVEARDRRVRRKLKEIRENSKESKENIRKAIANLEQMEHSITAHAEKTNAFFAELRVSGI